jgi:hypothetical protein
MWLAVIVLGIVVIRVIAKDTAKLLADILDKE